jgi:hypothetical protein
MYKKNKSVKQELKHLNDCYIVFENYASNQNIAEENKVQFINLMLQNYISSDKIITDEQLQEIKERNARE